jgi:hypothetical protein
MNSKFVVGFCAALALLIPGAAEAAGKQKTKSNNSNERCEQSCPTAPGEAGKTRTKSNNSNERCEQSCPTAPGEAATAPSAACDAGHRTYTGSRCFPDAAVVTQVSPASSTAPTPVTGMDCKPSPQAEGTPIGGINVKGGGCATSALPTAPSKGIKEKGIR